MVIKKHRPKIIKQKKAKTWGYIGPCTVVIPETPKWCKC